MSASTAAGHGCALMQGAVDAMFTSAGGTSLPADLPSLLAPVPDAEEEEGGGGGERRGRRRAHASRDDTARCANARP
eukprot:1966523-Alexandrium_andersonii.AAC.1